MVPTVCTNASGFFRGIFRVSSTVIYCCKKFVSQRTSWAISKCDLCFLTVIRLDCLFFDLISFKSKKSSFYSGYVVRLLIQLILLTLLWLFLTSEIFLLFSSSFIDVTTDYILRSFDYIVHLHVFYERTDKRLTFNGG